MLIIIMNTLIYLSHRMRCQKKRFFRFFPSSLLSTMIYYFVFCLSSYQTKTKKKPVIIYVLTFLTTNINYSTLYSFTLSQIDKKVDSYIYACAHIHSSSRLILWLLSWMEYREEQKKKRWRTLNPHHWNI